MRLNGIGLLKNKLSDYRNRKKKLGFPALKPTGSGLSEIKLSDYRIRIKVSDPPLCLSDCGYEDSLNEADGSRLSEFGYQTIGLSD
jgi:hypothetical protein